LLRLEIIFFSSCCFEREGFINNSSIDAEANNYWGAEFVDIIMEDGLYINGTVAVGCSPIATNITIHGSVTSIKDMAFLEKTSLQSVTIEDGVTSIGMMAFADCSSLRKITISESVTSIGWMAFNRCFSLREVYCKSKTPPAGDSDMFVIYYGNSFNIYVPASDDDSIINAYKVAEGWSNYADYISEYEFD
ncbi:MAG: leucine-rich repeat domain-containing protein, partial [Tidjanibacter sp.]|nr:leucine-rich repeat domain-containing protein [Tidjanibacter sp.]